jgi:hypothetical protein
MPRRNSKGRGRWPASAGGVRVSTTHRRRRLRGLNYASGEKFLSYVLRFWRLAEV